MPFWHSNSAADDETNASLPCHLGKRHLPQPRGPHSVGFVDVMTEGDEGVFARLLYPTDEQCLEEHHRWPHWLEDGYITGMLDFLKVISFVKKKQGKKCRFGTVVSGRKVFLDS